ncbi:dirigent protein 22-like [Rutidosis leptorrhynchoides]|uniref:dirigent protein 22-like n=1 Tax=Rutidosis leptorrhynchoides TaxID=125765 RepID=UPI003A995623
MSSHLKNTVTITFYLILSSSIFYQSNGVFYEEVSEAISMKRMEKTTHFHFFFHDIHSGKNPSAIKIAGTQDSSLFGDTYMMDNALTEGQNVSSKMVGKAQGMYAFAAKNEAALLMVVNYEFSYGEFNGSSISVLGRNPVFSDVREMPIVGGSGRFRYASGYALAHTVYFDPKTSDAIVEYNLYVKHY